MIIVLISGASSIHTVRWANGLSALGHEVHVVSQQKVFNEFSPEVKLHLFPARGMLGYYTMVPSIRRLLKKIKPDIVNAHYASGYGTTARLVNFHPLVLSVWGSDVFSFPNKSFLHKWVLRKNLLSADLIGSTSRCMAEEVQRLVPEINNIEITPFGVDLEAYSNLKPKQLHHKSKIVIGTVKTMSKIYGIDTLLEAYSILLKSLNLKGFFCRLQIELELRIVGGGDQLDSLKELAIDLGISNSVKFLGPVPHSSVPSELENIDIFVALSRVESFGVAVIEAGAAGCPVVVSDASGLAEITIDGVTGFVVPRDNPYEAAIAIERLVVDSGLRYSMGLESMAHVYKCYSWEKSLDAMLYLYRKALKKYV